jgi:hypothetical protein
MNKYLKELYFEFLSKHERRFHNYFLIKEWEGRQYYDGIAYIPWLIQKGATN